MTEIIYVLLALVGVFLFGTIWYRRKFKQKEAESDYFTYHYIQIRQGRKDTGMEDAIRQNHTKYEKRIRAWEKPVFGNNGSSKESQDN